MGTDRLEFTLKGASKIPLFFFFSIIGALVVIIIIQPMGPVLGIGTIVIFLALWIWFLSSVIRDILNKPKSITFGEEGIVYVTRRNTFRIAWGDIINVLEMLAPTGPRSSHIHRFSIFTHNAPEIWFSEFMLRAQGTKTPEENYADAKEFITRHVPAEKIKT